MPGHPDSLPSSRAYWLLKSEPDVFGYADLERQASEPWNGVRNYQARNFLRAMQPGDLCLYYHSQAQPSGVAGVACVLTSAVPDNLQFDESSAYHDPKSTPDNPRWSMVEVAAVAALPRFLSLDDLRKLPELSSMRLLQKGTRLSVMPVTADEFRVIVTAGGLDADSL
ncbi:EVE domain-containing protein [Deinococcus sp. KNUC1210]|uniref:EVE domain-containing protein n=1 Tax=Deinococcus sp. KNUC1210 TaxID=2917691 RepID=UPI001EF04ACF|nr:EVE domain-containing protein [Deinococcus sp. KNUC1210]ULH14549.1 EVE domain-containing protein [Deinococcus sp. KNUC1210]